MCCFFLEMLTSSYSGVVSSIQFDDGMGVLDGFFGWRRKAPRNSRKCVITWLVVSNIFYFHPYLGKWSNLTNIFQMGWNHQPVIVQIANSTILQKICMMGSKIVTLVNLSWVMLNTWTNGCGSKCKVWIKPRSHTRSRPPIQTIRKDLIQTFDPDLWNDIRYWWVDVWSSDGCMFLGFLLCSYSPCQAAKQQTVVKPRCQAVKKSSSQAATVAHPSCQTAKLTLLQVARPACQAAKLYTCCLHTLSSFSCHAASKLQHTQTCGPTSGPIQTRIQTDPDPIQATTSSDPDHNQLCVKTCDCLVSFLSSNSWFAIH